MDLPRKDEPKKDFTGKDLKFEDLGKTGANSEEMLEDLDRMIKEVKNPE